MSSNFCHVLRGTIHSFSSDIVDYKCISNLNGYYLGLYNFPTREDVMLLNFSDTSITLLDSTHAYDTTDYVLVKSKFILATIKICVRVDSIEYDFLFDTGSSFFLSLTQNDKHKKEKDTAIHGFVSMDASGMVIDTVVYQKTDAVTMTSFDSIKGTIDYKKKLSSPNMGMKFIANFDWIIDRGREKIYVKKIKDYQDEDIYSNYYRVDVIDTTLQISFLPLAETEYELFSIIDSANGEKVNMGNICKMSALLNKKNGFKDNQMVILPPRSAKRIKK